jgi:hypothetical protein
MLNFLAVAEKVISSNVKCGVNLVVISYIFYHTKELSILVFWKTYFF